MEILAKVISFDLDGTLAPSKQPMTEDMADLLIQLAVRTKIAIISGGSYEVMFAQLKPFVDKAGDFLDNVVILPTDGSERFEYDRHGGKWRMIYKRAFPKKIKEKVKMALEEVIRSERFDIPREHFGEYIEDRETEIVLSALGQQAPLEKKEVWDPDQAKRQKIRKYLEERLPEVEICVAGTTSIDILPKGFNKAVGLGIYLEHEKIHPADMIFVGDAIFPGGNDYSVFAAGMQSVKVSGPEEAAVLIRKMLEKPVAYFCSEYAIDDEDIQMYAGGLGVLAGDYLMEHGKQCLPFVALGLRYGKQVGHKYKMLELKGKRFVISIPVQGSIIKAGVWHRRIGGNTHLFLLDPDIPENEGKDRDIASQLYDIDFEVRLKQQMILGIGGVRLLEELGIRPRVYHLNEGHTAFAGMAILAERSEDAGKIVATKHTILSDAGLQVPRNVFNNLLSRYSKKVSPDYGTFLSEMFKKGQFELNNEIFSTTKFVMNVSVIENGVSAAHVYFEKKRHPHSQLISITNGVSIDRWQSAEIREKAEKGSDEELWNAKRAIKSRFSKFIEEGIGAKVDPDIATLVWARRFASYKRPELLFVDRERLIKMVNNAQMPLQIVISGRPHMSDTEGHKIAKMVHDISVDPAVRGRIILVPDYSVAVAKELVKGADIWLNTPERGYEACGTSGMKAALNGSLMVSVSDGWMEEVDWKDNGWVLPDADSVEMNEGKTAGMLYDILEKEVLPTFYKRGEKGVPLEWVGKMRYTMQVVRDRYNAARMVDDYRSRLYMLE